MLVPHPNIVPNCGYSYPQRLGDQYVLLVGGSYDDIVAKVERFRRDNKLEMGLPKADVYEYLCKTHIGLCREEDPALQKATPVIAPLPPAVRVSEWLRQLHEKSHHQIEHHRDPETRAKICAACSERRDWRCGACGASNRAIAHAGYTYRQGKDVSTVPVETLTMCGVTGACTRTLAYVSDKNLPEITQEAKDKLPAHCFLRQ